VAAGAAAEERISATAHTVKVKVAFQRGMTISKTFCIKDKAHAQRYAYTARVYSGIQCDGESISMQSAAHLKPFKTYMFMSSLVGYI
jgi:hypothetical protein